MVWHTGDGRDSTAAKGSDQPPLHGGELLAIEYLRVRDRERQNGEDGHHQYKESQGRLAPV